jgi:hypothetical protein
MTAVARANPVTAALLVAGSIAIASPARAQGGACADAIAGWASRCARTERIEISPSHCPPGRLVVRVGGEAPTSVEIGPAGPGSFRRAGALGLSPIGEFADWSKEPEARQRGLDALEACVTKDPPALVASIERPGAATSIPWLLLGALTAVALACAARLRERRLAWGTALGLVAAACAVWLFRWLLLPGAFFHQNGHGASWIAYALNDHRSFSSYGPGYAELFGWVARAGGDQPERAVFLAQSVIAALSIPCAFVVARGCGAGRPLAAALALVVALDPLSARLAQSESYFATFAGLAFFAAAVLAQAGRRVRSLPFLAAVVAAGLITAQAARVHPLGWVALALLPAVVACGLGRLRTRLIAAGVAGGGIATIVAITSGGAMLDVLRGSLGQQWLPLASPRISAALWVIGATLLAALVTRSRRGTLLGGLGALAVIALLATNLVSSPSSAVARAYERPFWPVLIGLAGAVLGRIAKRRLPERAVAAGVALTAAAMAVLQFRSMTELPTDAREAQLAIEWRRQLPEKTIVAYVARVDHHIFALPLSEGVTSARSFPIMLGDDPLPDLSQLGGTLHYYRSSVCASAQARERCDQLERSLRFEPIVEHELPALPSMRWNRYATDRVKVALFRRIRAQPRGAE